MINKGILMRVSKSVVLTLSMLVIVSVSMMVPNLMLAQQRLTLEDCREMAIDNNKELSQSAIEIQMAKYDRGIARANYMPKISATAAYLFNTPDISLIGDEASARLRSSGTLFQEQLSNKIGELTQAVMSNPQALEEFMGSPIWQTLIGTLSNTDLSGAINQIGSRLDDALHFDIQNIYVGLVSLTEPIFTGGKIIAANRIAILAEQLAKDKYDTKYQEIIVGVDQAYWQIVAIAAKKELAESYSDLLEKMLKDAEALVAEGVATESDLLSVKVKANEAAELLLKASNGLKLAKMLLCKEIGLPLDSDIILSDEGGEIVPTPQVPAEKTMEDIWEDRSEIRSLSTAVKIYNKKVVVARADMLPTIGLTANYLISNPNLNDGFRNHFQDRFSAGVMLNIPIFHGLEASYKTKKARAEALLMQERLEDAREMVCLEVSKYKNERSEAIENLTIAESNLQSAEENLRTATIGFEEGVVEANTAMAAQTAWLRAHSEYIEAGIALQMATVSLQRAQGEVRSDER